MSCGTTGTPSANIPSPTALAASWDAERVARIGSLLAAEARRKGVDVILAPTVNLHRTPYGGRHFECFSEDPLLTGRIGVAYVEGVQGSGVGATVKHFVANDSETERFTVDARVDERTLRELYLAPFEAIVGAGVWAVMAAYNSVNGTTMTEHPMLRAILHDEWGWDGLVMSDWFATRSTAPAANAALDLAMPGPYSPWGDDLVSAVRAGEVPESVVDDKVDRLLRLADRVSAGGYAGRAVRRSRPSRRPPSCAAPPRPGSSWPATPAACCRWPPTGCAASPCSARTRPPPVRSAAAARRSSRRTRCHRSTACGRRSARLPGRRPARRPAAGCRPGSRPRRCRW